MALVHVSKLKIVFFLLVGLYVLVGLIAYELLQTKFSRTSDLTPQLLQNDFKAFTEAEWAESLSHSRTSVPQNDFKLFSVGKERFLNLRNVGKVASTEELDYFLNIRKLILFAVHELNEPLKYTNCTKWWANPLDMMLHEAKFISEKHTDHLMKFYIQPGNLELEVIIRQQTTPIGLKDRELEMQSTFKLQKGFEGGRCGEESISDDVAKFCLCEDHENFIEFQMRSNELRETWTTLDPELITWNPDTSFYVTDYMNFTDYEWFVAQPGQTIEDVAKLSYSTEYCGPDIKMLVMISSAPGHYEQRSVIRETYASASNLEGKGIKVVFLMGVPTDETLNDDVKYEAHIYQDIIQANFDDCYHNLTLSHLSMYKWAHLTCINGKNSGVTVPQFLLKADDDFLLNLDLALQVAEQNSEYEFIGCLFCGIKPVRDSSLMRKYYTPRYMYISSSYCGYLSGVVYMMRTDVIPLLLHMSTTTPIIHMDDAYVTGILLRQVAIQPRDSKLFTYGRIDPDACESKRMVASYVLDTTDMKSQWDAFVQPIPQNCTLKDLKIKLDKISDLDRDYCYFKHN